MGIRNREGALYMATGVDNSGLYAGRREAIGIIKAMAGQITSFDVFSGIGISAATAFAQAAKSSYDFEKEFHKNMLEVATISTQVEGSMTDFMNQVMSITQVIPIKAPDAAKALYQIVSAGHDGADGMNVLEVAAKSAIGGITDTVTAADAITTLLNAYKLSASDAEKVSDQLFTTARLGKTTFGEMGQSIAQVAPIAAAYGVEMDQVLAAIATLTKSGTPTAQAMTQIRASIIGTSKVLGDGAFDSMTFQEALAEIANRAGGSEAKLRELIPEVEAVNGVLGLTGIKAQDAADHLKEMNNSAGATEAAFKLMMNDVDKQMTLLSNNIQAALRPMGSAILKNVSEAAQMINEGFKTGQIQNSMEALQKLLIAVAGAFVTYKSAAIGASTAEALHSAKVTISNNLKSLQSQITGEAIITKEKERIHLEAYTASLEKSITEEQRAKLAKLDLKAGSQEYMKALSEQALQEKTNADKQVESLTKLVNKNKEKLSAAQDNLEMSHQAVEAAKAELNAAIEANDSVGFEIAQTKLNAAAQREEAASTNVAATSKGLKASESQLITSTTTAEVAATRVNTATTVADTAVTNIATTAKNRLKVATIALWGAMKANPLGAVLTLVSLAATTYMLFADKVKAAETGQSRLNKLNKAATESIADEKAELMLLLSVAKNELVSKEDRTKAIKKLNDISPEYLGNLSLENIGTKEATTSIDAYTLAIGRNAKAKALMDEMNPLYRDQLKYEQELYALQKKSDDLKANKLGFSDEQLYYANLEISGKIKNKTQQKAEIDKQIQDVLDMYNDELSNETKLKPIKVDIPVNIQIESEQANINALLKKKEEIEARIKKDKDSGFIINPLDTALLVTVNNELTKTNNKLIALNKETANPDRSNIQPITKEVMVATQKVSTLKQELSDLRSGKTSAEAGKTVQQTIEDKVKELQTAESALATLTGQTTKETDKLLKTQTDLSRSIFDSEIKLQAGRISAMEEGKSKRIEIAKQEYQETLATICKEKEEYEKNLKETGGKKDPAVLSTFDNRESAARDKKNTDLAKIDKEYAEEYKERTKALTDVFLNEEERKLAAVKDRYSKERKWADEQLTTGGMTTEEHKSYTTTVDQAQMKENYNTLLSSLNDFKQQEKSLREKWDTDIAAAVETKDAYLVARLMEGKQKALSALNSQMLQESSEWMRLFGNLDTLTVDELNKLIDSIQKQLDSGTLKLNPVDAKALMDSLNQAKDKVAEKSPFQALAKSSGEMKKALADLKKAEDDGLTGEALDEYKTKVKNSAENVKKSIAAIGDAYGKVRDVMQSAADMISMVDEGLGETVNNAMTMADAVMGIGDVVAQAVIGFANGMSTMETASVILLIIKAVLVAVMAAIALFNGDKKHEKKIKEMQGQVDALERSYDKLGRAIDKTYSREAADMIGQQNENLEKQNELLQQQIAEEEAKKKTDKDKIKDWQNAIEDNNQAIEENKEKAVDAIFGSDIQSAIDDFASAYADAWAAGEDRATAMKDVVKNMIKGVIMEMLKLDLKPTVEALRKKIDAAMVDGIITDAEQAEIDALVESAVSDADKKYAPLDKYLKEDKSPADILGTSSDSLADTIIDGLAAGKSGIVDFSDSFEDMMRDAILNSLKAKYLEGPLKEFQKKFAELSESGGQLTEAEIEELRSMYADIIDGAKAQFDGMKDIAGLDFTADSENSLKGAYAKASEESITLLAGQTGASRKIQEEILNSMIPIREQMQAIRDMNVKGWEDVKAIRDLTTKIDKNTEQVAENTRQIKEVADKVADNTRNTADALEGTINVKIKGM